VNCSLSKQKENIHKRIKDFYEKTPYGGRGPLQEMNVRYQQILDQIINYGGSNFLDVGCGNGSFECSIEDHIENYVGIDISSRAIQIAKQSSKKGMFLIGSACALPIRNGSNNLILCSEVLEHIPDYWMAVKEISRVLQADGHLILTTPNYMNPSVLLTSLYARLRGVSRTMQIYDKPVPHHRLLSILNICGMRVIHINSFYSNFTTPRLSLKIVFRIVFEQLIKFLSILTRRPYKLYLILIARKEERH